jgi:hypothetical protein
VRSRSVTVRASLLHDAAAIIEKFNGSALWCAVCGADLDRLIPVHREGCASETVAKALREALVVPKMEGVRADLVIIDEAEDFAREVGIMPSGPVHSTPCPCAACLFPPKR